MMEQLPIAIVLIDGSGSIGMVILGPQLVEVTILIIGINSIMEMILMHINSIEVEIFMQYSLMEKALHNLINKMVQHQL